MNITLYATFKMILNLFDAYKFVKFVVNILHLLSQ